MPQKGASRKKSADGRFTLRFRDPSEMTHVSDALGRDISALAVIGRTLFCACDETATVERLIYDPEKGDFSGHENFPLSTVFDLPGGAGGEMDIEGLAVDDGFLWITGSHSLKRDKPADIEPALSDIADIDWDKNRGFLGRLPLADRGDGVFEPVASIEPIGQGDMHRRAAMMKMGDDGTESVRKLVGNDPLLAPFMETPCKENGFDVEGLAVRGERVLLGLRGPVLGAFAVVIEMRMKMSKKGRLKPRKLGDKRYRLHLVDLQGLGIRDMLFAGDSLLFLAGPTQDIEGLQKIFAIDDLPDGSGFTRANAVRMVRSLEIRDGEDHAEGIALFTPEKDDFLLVAHDSPGPDRYDAQKNRLEVDVFPL